MNTINTAAPALTQRPQSQPPAPTQSAHAPSEETGDTSRPGKLQAEPQAKGVLRLLQEGHFKGVADVRLRINFHEQLTALDSAAEQGSTIEAVGAFNTSISESLAAHETIPVPVAEAVQRFQVELADLGYAAEDAAGLSGAAGAAFAGLISTLNELLPAAAESEESSGPALSQEVAEHESIAEETSVPVDEADVAPAAGEKFDAAALIAVLESGFASFQEALLTAQVSHEFTPPKGIGVAFDKFLEIYRSLSSVEIAGDAEEDSGSVIDLTV